MNLDHHWEYKTITPKPTRIYDWDMYLPVGHRYGYKRRADRFNPKVVQYQFYCLCKWRTENWWRTRPMAAKMAEKYHTIPLMRQGRLWDDEAARNPE